MSSIFTLKRIAALLTGVITGAVLTTILLSFRADDGHFHSHDESSGAYHIHADFLVIVNDTKVNLSGDEYMSKADKVLHPGVHLHDNKDDVIHFHARDITLVEFLSSLDITLTKDCLTIADTTSCTSDEKSLLLFVNGQDQTDTVENYVPQDNDRILLYYGIPNNPQLNSYLTEVTDRACMYSGTCPERGTPPPEECGLTCEL